MRETVLTIPELALVVGTRAAAGLGVGLLVAHQVPAPVRRPIGWTLLLVGLLSTLPLAFHVFRHSRIVAPPE